LNASEDDILITVGTGMSGAISKFHRILGLKVVENLKDYTQVPDALRPVVWNSFQPASWLETIAKVEVVPSNDEGLICLDNFKKLLYKEHPYKRASLTACSNVTGIKTDYHSIARIKIYYIKHLLR
jgi:selenocysteine lyase/cysteine desulfurase